MAEEATSQAALPEAPTESQDSSGQAEQTSSETPATRKVNLFELDEFKDVQRSWQSKLSERDQTIAQLQQQLNQLEDKIAPNDYARLENRLRRVEQERNVYAQQLQQIQQQQAIEAERQAALTDIAKEFGVSKADLESARDYKEAVKLAVKAQARRNAEKQKEQAERTAANRPDVGGGKTLTSDDRYEKALDDAMKRGDAVAYVRLINKGKVD